jgi:CRISPR/Cas system CMR subunit Cmr4 (Cas7 group RAMP superfamily)
MTLAETALRFTVELQEDLHAGSGVGWLGLVDDRHARDASGRPVVWWSTFRGVLREAGEDYLISLKRAAEEISDADEKKKQLDAIASKRRCLYALLGKPVNGSSPDRQLRKRPCRPR